MSHARRAVAVIVALVLMLAGVQLRQGYDQPRAVTYLAVGSAGAGADYSFYRPSDAQLRGLTFVARYVVPASFHNGKALTRAEAAHLHTRGLAILLNFELSTVGPAAGYGAGVRDGGRVVQALAELGVPRGPPVYFSVDFDASFILSPVLDYLAGAAAVLGRDRVGVYGGYAAVRAALDAGYRWAWQTAAWSRGRWDPRAQVRQTGNGALWAGQGDRDVALAPFGGWDGTPARTIGGSPGGRRGRMGSRPPRATPRYRVHRGDTLSAIARRHHTTVRRLAARNHIRDVNRIYAGQLLAL